MSNYKKWNKTISMLEEFLKALPSKEDLDKILESIRDLMEFLKQTENSLSNLPTSEEAEKAQNALEQLRFILERNPLLKNYYL